MRNQAGSGARLLRAMVGVAGLAIAAWVQAAPGVRTTDSGTIAGSYAYSETATDMTVKVLGGEVTIEREWRQGQWRFFPSWQSLRATLVEGGPNETIAGLDELDFAAKSELASLRRGRYTYERVEGSEPTRWRFDATRWIVATDDGYRWENRAGDWINYDEQGRMSAYGGRNEVRVSVERDRSGRIKRVLDHHGELAVEVFYEGQGRVVRIRDRSGREVSYDWNDKGQLAAVDDVRGARWQYSYEDVGSMGIMRLVSRTDPDGRKTELDYRVTGGTTVCVPTGGGHWVRDNNGELVWRGRCVQKMIPKRVLLDRKSDARGTIESYTYAYNGDDGAFSRVTEQGKRYTETKRDEQGRITERRVNGEVVERYRYSDGERVRIDSQGRETSTQTNTFDEPVRKEYPDGSSETWSYNEYGQVTRHVNEVGTVTEHTYDANGNRTRTVEAKGTPAERVITYSYDQYGQRTSRKLVGDANTQTAERTWTYDRYGNVETMTDAAGHTRTYTGYTVRGEPTAWTDRSGHQWQQTFDAAGNRRTRTDPLGHQQQWQYDGAGNRTARIDALGNHTEITYDEAGLRTQVTDPTGATTTLQYDDQRRVTAVTDADGVTHKLVYNDAGRLAKSVSPADIAETMSYGVDRANANSGRLVRFESPQLIVKYRYDSRGRRTAKIVIGSEGARRVTRYSYDAEGRLLQKTDPAGRTTRYRYDALGRRTQTTDPQGNTVDLTYDDRGNITKVVNERGVTLRRYTYSARGNRTQTVWPDGETHRYAYDAMGRRARYTDAKGQVEATSYDAAGRRTQVTYYASEAERQAGNAKRTTTFSYDAAGRMTGYADGTSSATYTFDTAGRKTSASIDFGAFTAGWSRTYTAAGRKKSLTYPDGQTVTYAYDAAGRLDTITRADGATLAFGYSDQTGRKTNLTLPGGTERTWAYDGIGRIQKIGATDPAGNALDERRYTYSDAGNITRIDTLEGAHTYGYDALDRLTSATHPQLADEAFTYDPAGNRTTSADTDGTWQYNAANQLTGYDDTTFEYDANGAMTKEVAPDGTTTYAYGIRRRLKRIEQPDGTVQTNAYDPMERRVKKTVDGETTYFVYTEAGLIAELDGSGDTERSYGWYPDGEWSTDPLWMTANGETAYYATDHLGTPQKAVDASGATQWAARYEAFGQASIEAEKMSSPWRFPGQIKDGRVDLAFNGFRSYLPSIGRYVRSDPFDIAFSLNPYLYASANPLRFRDPWGLEEQSSTPCHDQSICSFHPHGDKWSVEDTGERRKDEIKTDISKHYWIPLPVPRPDLSSMSPSPSWRKSRPKVGPSAGIDAEFLHVKYVFEQWSLEGKFIKTRSGYCECRKKCGEIDRYWDEETRVVWRDVDEIDTFERTFDLGRH